MNRRGFLVSLMALPAVAMANRALPLGADSQQIILKAERGWVGELIDSHGNVALSGPVEWSPAEFGRAQYSFDYSPRGVERYGRVQCIRLRRDGVAAVESFLDFGHELTLIPGNTLRVTGHVWHDGGGDLSMLGVWP